MKRVGAGEHVGGHSLRSLLLLSSSSSSSFFYFFFVRFLVGVGTDWATTTA